MNSISRVLLGDLVSDIFDSESWFNSNLRFVGKKKLEDDSIEYTVEVPGYEKNQLNVKVVDGVLQIKGERSDGSRISFEEFVGRDVITSAKLKNGMLKVGVKNSASQTIEVAIEE